MFVKLFYGKYSGNRRQQILFLESRMLSSTDLSFCKRTSYISNEVGSRSWIFIGKGLEGVDVALIEGYHPCIACRGQHNFTQLHQIEPIIFPIATKDTSIWILFWNMFLRQKCNQTFPKISVHFGTKHELQTLCANYCTRLYPMYIYRFFILLYT